MLFVTAVGPPAVLASLKPLNNIIQLPLHVPCIVSNNYTAIGSGLYATAAARADPHAGKALATEGYRYAQASRRNEA